VLELSLVGSPSVSVRDDNSIKFDEFYHNVIRTDNQLGCRERVLCTTLPLDAQGGIKGGLDLAFRFALRCPAPLDGRSAR